MSLLAFFVSFALAAATSLVTAGRFRATLSERMWIALAALACQLGLISVALSFTRSVTPGPFLTLQVTLLAIALMVANNRAQRCATLRLPRVRHPVDIALSVVICLLLLACVAVQAKMPLFHFDDRMYRASRAAYWVQHQSLLPWESHNDRQVSFPFGSELTFFWPLLFTRSEPIARTLFALVTPLTAMGLYSVLREVRISRRGSLAAVLLLITTPAVRRTYGGLSPEPWLALFVLGMAFFAVRAARRKDRARWHLFMIGLFAVLAVNVKTTAAILVPLSLLLPCVIGDRGSKRTRWSRVKEVAGGFVMGAVLSGFGFLTVSNFIREGHPLGPPGMIAVHSANLSAQQAKTHAARFLVSMIDVPIANTTLQARLTDAGRRFLSLCGVDRPLTLEADRLFWPGTYIFDTGEGGQRFSIGGMIWVPALIASLAGAAAMTFRRRRDGSSGISPQGVLAIICFALIAFTVMVVRWMGQIERFWVASYSVGAVIIALQLQGTLRRRSAVRYALGGILFLIALSSLRESAMTLRSPPPAPERVAEPYAAALHHIPLGSRILLVASDGTRDYPLFAPHHGYANTVISWGPVPFDAERFRELISRERVTHVLLEADTRILQVWHPWISAKEFTTYLRSDPTWREISPQLATPLYETRPRAGNCEDR